MSCEIIQFSTAARPKRDRADSCAVGHDGEHDLGLFRDVARRIRLPPARAFATGPHERVVPADQSRQLRQRVILTGGGGRLGIALRTITRVVGHLRSPAFASCPVPGACNRPNACEQSPHLFGRTHSQQFEPGSKHCDNPLDQRKAG